MGVPFPLPPPPHSHHPHACTHHHGMLTDVYAATTALSSCGLVHCLVTRSAMCTCTPISPLTQQMNVKKAHGFVAPCAIPLSRTDIT